MAEDGGETRGGRGGKAERGSHGDENNTHADNEGVQKKAEERANGGGGGVGYLLLRGNAGIVMQWWW